MKKSELRQIIREDIKRWMKLYDIINIEFLTN